METRISPWEWGWEALVALGTIGLAVATGIVALMTFTLARKTRDLAKETRDLGETTGKEVTLLEEQVAAQTEQAQLLKASHEQRLRPLLLDVPEEAPHNGRPHVQADQTEAGVAGFVSIPVRNCGEGAARLRGAALDCDGSGSYSLQARPSRLQWLPVGETERFFFDLAAGDGTPCSFGRFQGRSDCAIRVLYSDLAGNMWATRLDIRRDREEPWRIYGVFVTGEGRAPD